MFTDVTFYQLPSSEFSIRREKIFARLPNNTVAVLFAGKAPVASLDESYPFLPNRNFFYLSGIEQEESVLLLIKSGGVGQSRLYLYPREPEKEKWTGRRLAYEEASEISGISDVRELSAYERDLDELLGSDINFAWDESDMSHQRYSLEQTLAKTDRFDSVTEISSFLTQLRMLKSPREQEAITRAIQVTEESLEVLLPQLRPGISEREVYAILESEMIRRGSFFQGFKTIVAGGENTLCLHYPTPVAMIQGGQMIQIDLGARAAGYSADISRAYTANTDGIRNSRQQALFELICECKETALKTIRPGSTIAKVNEETRKTAASGLRDLGVIPRSEKDPLEAVKKYYWHNTLHHLGLDVHDVCDREAAFAADMVFAVEPGIYIPEWGFGFRVEDDVLVTADGSRYLSHPQK
ncbi:MAG: aminopeptidase P N-terminal domain-containing protein [Clostridiales bacterium]|nr:aminopeptidase P N-terminal domain-containing protein [Clostridiales bacterium]